jgi:hypothetical protein
VVETIKADVPHAIQKKDNDCVLLLDVDPPLVNLTGSLPRQDLQERLPGAIQAELQDLGVVKRWPIAKPGRNFVETRDALQVEWHVAFSLPPREASHFEAVNCRPRMNTDKRG